MFCLLLSALLFLNARLCFVERAFMFVFVFERAFFFSLRARLFLNARLFFCWSEVFVLIARFFLFFSF